MVQRHDPGVLRPRFGAGRIPPRRLRCLFIDSRRFARAGRAVPARDGDRLRRVFQLSGMGAARVQGMAGIHRREAGRVRLSRLRAPAGGVAHHRHRRGAMTLSRGRQSWDGDIVISRAAAALHDPQRLTAPYDDGALDLTVFVSCYNEAEHISGTLDAVCSAAAEARLAYEIIVVDDGSRDDSRRIVADYIASHPG